jgi:glycine cleavage system pyridoxal-binding protein P
MYRKVVETYFAPPVIEVVELPWAWTAAPISPALITWVNWPAWPCSPQFLRLHRRSGVQPAKHSRRQKTLFVTAFSEPLAYGCSKARAACGADIACGEGQSFGIPRASAARDWVFAAKQKYVRTMPGRLIGKTTDRDGKTGFVLTLATREQHIRRERATSNICSNQGLCATAATMYMAAMGGTGIPRTGTPSTATGPNTSKANWPRPGMPHLSHAHLQRIRGSLSRWIHRHLPAAAAGEKDRCRTAPGALLSGTGRLLAGVRDRNHLKNGIDALVKEVTG